MTKNKFTNDQVAQLLAIHYVSNSYKNDPKPSIKNPDETIRKYNVAYGTFLASLDHNDQISKQRREERNAKIHHHYY